MGQNAMPWTLAMDKLLQDAGDWVPLEDVLAVGTALVPEDRALREMGSKQTSQTPERRVAIGRRNVAMQGVTGRVRFLHYSFSPDKKKLRWVSDKSRSTGELVAEVDALRSKVEQLEGQVESMQVQLDRLDALSEGGSPNQAAEALFAAVTGSPLS